MDPSHILSLLESGQYALVAALVLFIIVRLLKSDTKIPIDIPSRYRKALALFLAFGAAVLEKFALGESWKKALLDGAFAWMFAEWGHYLIIDRARGGREFYVPGLTIPGAAPSPGKPPSVKPPPMPPLPPAAVFLLALSLPFLSGCPKAWKVAEILADKAACVVANQDLDPKLIAVKCAIENFENYADLLATSRAATKKALERQAAERKVADDAARANPSPYRGASTRVDADAGADGGR